MATAKLVKKIVFSLEDTSEKPHFDSVAFTVKDKIFVTLNEKANRITVKLSAIDQSVFCSYNLEIIHPVPNAWGKHGWTNVHYKKIKNELLKDLLETAYKNVLNTIKPKKPPKG
jgi:predicted DNA-binding protein (MmcQ/YjbR family)